MSSSVAVLERVVVLRSKLMPFKEWAFPEVTHFWIKLPDGSIEVAPRTDEHNMHVKIWGEQVWGIHMRGYYYGSHSALSCNWGCLTEELVAIEGKIIKKLEAIGEVPVYATYVKE
jgi:hypothetical protein